MLLLLTQQPQVRFSAIPRIFLLLLLRFIDGTGLNSGQRLDNVNRAHLVLASCNLVLQKNCRSISSFYFFLLLTFSLETRKQPNMNEKTGRGLMMELGLFLASSWVKYYYYSRSSLALKIIPCKESLKFTNQVFNQTHFLDIKIALFFGV